MLFPKLGGIRSSSLAEEFSPTYWWALPSIVRDFLQKAVLQADYRYYIAIYGTSPGASAEFAIQYGKNTQFHGQYTNPNVKV